jgi:preprotein translocase subunit SecA
LIRYFSITSPVAEADKADRNWINRKVYKEALKYYQEKTERSAREAFPIIKNIYEDKNNQFERSAIHRRCKIIKRGYWFEKAYESEGKQLIADFEKKSSLIYRWWSLEKALT